MSIFNEKIDRLKTSSVKWELTKEIYGEEDFTAAVLFKQSVPQSKRLPKRETEFYYNRRSIPHFSK